MAQVPCARFCCFPEERDPEPYPAVNFWCHSCRPVETMPEEWPMRSGWITYEKVHRKIIPHSRVYRPKITKQRVYNMHTFRELPRPRVIKQYATCRAAFRAYYKSLRPTRPLGWGANK